MTLRYYARQAGLCPAYVCQRKGIENAEAICQHIAGVQIDRVVSDMLLELVNPVTLDVALTVQQELQRHLDESDRLRKQQVERARYEAELAQRRYMLVDPGNRLVADTLEADWNHKLRAFTEAQREYEHTRRKHRLHRMNGSARGVGIGFPCFQSGCNRLPVSISGGGPNARVVGSS
jgi:hypothetical protein